MASRSDYLVPMLLGAATGVIVSVLIWRIASKQLAAGLLAGKAMIATNIEGGIAEVDRQMAAGEATVKGLVQTTVQTELAPKVREQVAAQLRANGLTPQMISALTQTFAYARRAGVIT